MNKASQSFAVVVCVVALLALPVLASCSSVVSAVNSLTHPASSSSSAQADEKYYLGIDQEGRVALFKGKPAEGATPVRTTDIMAGDLHESVVAGLKEGIAFDSFNEAIERIGDYREAARTTVKAREAEKAAADEAAAQAKREAEAAAAAVPPAPSAEAPAAPAAPVQAQPAPSDENAPAGQFWGVWLGGFQNLDDAYAYADEAKAQGFSTEVFEVTNWDGARYVVGAGEYATKSEAQAVLDRALALGHSAAYLHTAARQ